MYQRILVPTDGTALSHKAVQGAIGLAKAVGAEVVALHVVPRYPASYLDGAMTRSATEVAQIEKQWADGGQAMVGAVGRLAAEAGVRVKAVTMHSDLVAEAILAAARKHECDLVVMASHGRRGVRRLLLGSETQHVLTHGNIPVLVLR